MSVARSGDRGIVQFGVFELNLKTGELRKCGIRVRLQKKSFDVLAALLEKPGTVVSRDDLRCRLWPADTVGAFDTGLNTAVNRLRLALGDSADKPLYFETVARSGYRFIAPVRQPVLLDSSVITLTSIPSTPIPASRPRSRLPYRRILIIVSLLAALASVIVFSSRTSQATFRQITFQRGNIWGARFSPDGQNILYSAEWEGRPRALFLTQPASPESRNFGFSGMTLSSISRRGELALLTYGGTMNISGGVLSRVPMNGGAPLEVGRNIMAGEWSPDGNALAVVHAIQGQNWLEFPIGKVLFRTPGSLSSPRFSPDGQKLAFVEHPVRHDDSGAVIVIDLRGKIQGRLPDWSSVSGLAWHPRSREVWFTAARTSSLRSVWAWHPGGRLRPIAQAPGILTLRDIASDGRLLISRDTRRLEMAGRIQASHEDRIMTWLDWSRVQEISPDGSLVLFDESGEGAGPQSIVYLYRTKEANAVRIGEGRAMSLAPDLRHVLTLDSQDRRHFRVLATEGTDVLDLPATGLQYQWGRFFPDGQHLLTLASEPGKGLQLYVEPIGRGSGRPKPITPPMAVRNVAISPSGTEIAVLASDGDLIIYPSNGGTPRVIASGENLAPMHWSRDGRHIFVQHLRAYTDLPAVVSRIDSRSGQIEIWKEIAPDDRTGVTSVTGIAISADEQSYVYSYRRLLAELFVVEGWR